MQKKISFEKCASSPKILPKKCPKSAFQTKPAKFGTFWSEPFCRLFPHQEMTKIWLFKSRSLLSIYIYKFSDYWQYQFPVFVFFTTLTVHEHRLGPLSGILNPKLGNIGVLAFRVLSWYLETNWPGQEYVWCWKIKSMIVFSVRKFSQGQGNIANTSTIDNIFFSRARLALIFLALFLLLACCCCCCCCCCWTVLLLAVQWYSIASLGHGLPQGVWPTGGSLPGKLDKDTRTILQEGSMEETATRVSS